jgi:hypothetical protein
MRALLTLLILVAMSCNASSDRSRQRLAAEDVDGDAGPVVDADPNAPDAGSDESSESDESTESTDTPSDDDTDQDSDDDSEAGDDSDS